MSFISFEEVAKRLGLSRSTIERMVERGEFIQPFRFSRGALRFDADELQAWVAQRRQPHTADASDLV